MRDDFFALLRKRDNRYHLFGCKLFIMGIGIVVPIAAEHVNVHFQTRHSREGGNPEVVVITKTGFPPSRE